MNTDLTRRTFLAGGVLVVGGGAWWLLGRPRPLGPAELTALRLAESVGLPEAEGLGARYLELHRDEADEEQLFALVFPGAGDGDEEALRALLAEAVERDWAELDTVQLDGWVLARTEGRFLALVALLEPRAGS